MRDLTASIKNSLKMLETGAHRKNSVSEQKEFFEKISQQVQEFKYFSEILEIDHKMKNSIQAVFESCMMELISKIDLD